jgi:hypothetical protein
MNIRNAIRGDKREVAEKEFRTLGFDLMKD